MCGQLGISQIIQTGIIWRSQRLHGPLVSINHKYPDGGHESKTCSAGVQSKV